MCPDSRRLTPIQFTRRDVTGRVGRCKLAPRLYTFGGRWRRDLAGIPYDADTPAPTSSPRHPREDRRENVGVSFSLP